MAGWRDPTGPDRRLLREARVAQCDLIWTIGSGLLAGILLVGQARVLSWIIGRAFLTGQPLSRLWPLLFSLVAMAMVRAVLAWSGEVGAGHVAGRVKSQLQNYLAAHITALGPLYARGEHTGELANTIVEGIEALDAYFRHYLPQIALAALVPAAVLIVVFPLDWLSGLVLLLTAPLIPIFMTLIGSQAEALTRRQWASLSRMSAHFLDALQGLATLKMLGRSREHIRLIALISDRFRQTTMGVLRVTFLSALVLEMVATVGTAVVAVEVGLRLLHGRLAFEQALFVLLLAPEFYLPLRLLGTRFHAGISGAAAAERIFAILDARVPVADLPEAPGNSLAASEPTAGRTDPASSGAQPPGLVFDQVCYAYDEGGRAALSDVSFEIPPGCVTALVGPSGAGKSTVAYLLLRFIEPSGGEIRVDGRPLTELGVSVWRERVAWVPQQPHLFHGTIAENIRLGRPAADQEAVLEAARQAHAHEFIAALPAGYETIIGERGAGLSGGEAQRIALARAFLRDAPLIVLDEATAHLDAETEALVHDAVAHLLRGRTALIIAHRLATVREASQILVIDRGQIIETGQHVDLAHGRGLYARLICPADAACSGELAR